MKTTKELAVDLIGTPIDHEVVLTILDEETGEATSYEVDSIDLEGWKESKIVSIVGSKIISS